MLPTLLDNNSMSTLLLIDLLIEVIELDSLRDGRNAGFSEQK